MVIGPVTSSPISFSTSETVSPAAFANTASTLTILQEFREKRKFSIFSWIAKQFSSLWSWLVSWIPRRSQPMELFYFKIEDGEEGVNKYRLLKEGKRTQNVVTMGKKTAYLNEFSFPDSSALQDLPKMLDQIIEREQIELIQTKSLQVAWRLWKCGLKTKSVWTLDICPPTPVGQRFVQIIHKAMEDRQTLGQEALCALEQIEEELVKAVVTDAFMQQIDLQIFFQHEISELERVFPEAELWNASARVMENSELPTIQSMTSDYQMQVPCAIPHGLDVEMKVDVPISLLFTIANAVALPIDRSFAAHTNHSMIFKQEKSPCAF